MIGVLLRRGEHHMKMETRWEHSSAKVEAGIGELQPQAQEHQLLPEAERVMERLSSRGFRGSMALITP